MSRFLRFLNPLMQDARGIVENAGLATAPVLRERNAYRAAWPSWKVVIAITVTGDLRCCGRLFLCGTRSWSRSGRLRCGGLRQQVLDGTGPETEADDCDRCRDDIQFIELLKGARQ